MVENEGLNLESAIAEMGQVITSTAGTSMYPMLRNKRDMVVVGRVERKLKKYDVPVYRLKSGKIVMHRILKVKENGYIIRGDNLIKKEYDITDENIIGALKAFYRNGKYYDCETSKAYKVYIFFNQISFPLRYAWKGLIRPILGKFKRFILKKIKNFEK